VPIIITTPLSSVGANSEGINLNSTGKEVLKIMLALDLFPV